MADQALSFPMNIISVLLPIQKKNEFVPESMSMKRWVQLALLAMN
jgi:hypothetical protein